MQTAKHILTQLIPAAVLLCAGPASAQTSVALTGIMGQKALLVVNGSKPRVLAVGESLEGVKLITLDPRTQEADVESLGQIQTLRVGSSPISVGAGLGSGGQGRVITIPGGRDGHFFTDGYINGRNTRFMVDTGASSVVIGRSEAKRLGLQAKNAQPSIQVSTANGMVSAQPTRLAKLRVGEVELYDVEAIVGPDMPFILLGNSFLSRFKMERSNDMMRLERTR